jgi:hypothetical protein
MCLFPMAGSSGCFGPEVVPPNAASKKQRDTMQAIFWFQLILFIFDIYLGNN